MYPLVQIGPLRLSSGGLLLLLSIILGGWLIARVAQTRGGAQLALQADSCFYPVLIGTVIGARLWYGLFNLDLYGRNPGLFLALRVNDFAWPGALLGGLLAGYVWCRRNDFDALRLADSAALTLPVVQAVASVGLLLSGEDFGVIGALMLAIQEFIIVMLILPRRCAHVAVAGNSPPAILAWCGTILPLLLRPSILAPVSLALLGNAFQLAGGCSCWRQRYG